MRKLLIAALAALSLTGMASARGWHGWIRHNPPGPVGGPGYGRFRGDNDNNPPGRVGGPGTNWENKPGWRGGRGASPNRHRLRPCRIRRWR